MNDGLTDETYARAALTYLAEPADRWLGDCSVGTARPRRLT